MGGSGDLLGTCDTFVLAIPILAAFALWIFGLDERVASAKRNSRPRRFFCEVDPNGAAYLSDPDGKLWKKAPVRQIEARFAGTRPSGWIESRLDHSRR